MSAHQHRLAQAQERGYVIGSRRDPVSDAYWRWCRSQRRPFVLVTVRRRYASGELNFEPTLHLDPSPRIGSTIGKLSAQGAEMIQTFYLANAAPYVRRLSSGAGECHVVIAGIPSDLADELGALLYAAATTAPDEAAA